MIRNRAVGRMRLRVAAFVAFATLLVGSRAFAQDRGGFTALVNSGVGVQRDASKAETAVGLTGLNVGVGGFLTRNVALMFRLAGTNVRYDVGASGDYRQVSGVAASTVQYWVSDKFNIEAGAGSGFWATDEEVQAGLGLIFGTGVTMFNRGKHNLQFGVHYAPAFTNPGTIHNIGFTFGYQFL